MSARNVLEALSQSKKITAHLRVINKQSQWLTEAQSLKALAAEEALYKGTVTPTAPKYQHNTISPEWTRKFLDVNFVSC